MYFRSYGLAKNPLDKYPKNAISQYPSKRNVVKALNNNSNHRSGTFIIVIYHR